MQELKTDIEVIKNDLTYIREFIESIKGDHKKLQDELTQHRQEFTAHVSKVKGAGVLMSTFVIVANLYNQLKL